jgi:hypothetical protein
MYSRFLLKNNMCTLKKIMICLFAYATFSANGQDSAQWKSSSMIIDGFAKEWNPLANYYDAESHIMYGIGNDNEYIYICLVNRDEKSQMKMLKGGMKIAISVKGKDKRKAIISYPLGKQVDMPNMQQQPPSDLKTKPDLRPYRQMFLLKNTNMELENFIYTNGTVPIKDSLGISAAINWDSNGMLVYELRVPIKEMLNNPHDIKALNAEWTVKVEVNGLERPIGSRSTATDNMSNSNTNPQSPMGNMGGGNMGSIGSMGGMRTSNPPSMDPADRNTMFESDSFKHKFRLNKR